MRRYFNPSVADRDLKYYIFDWDDNILHMPTRIHLERKTDDGKWVPHQVSTSLYAVIRKDTENYRAPDGNWEKAFAEFRDFESDDESKFLKDARTAIANTEQGTQNVPPSFNTFRRTLIEGRLFAIVTARGHKSSTLRKGVEMFIDKVLSLAEKEQMMFNLRGYVACFEGEDANNRKTNETILDDYLSLNKYHAVTSPAFRVLAEKSNIPDIESSEARKQFAIMDFLEHLFTIIERIGITKPISVGFSDDDQENVRAVSAFISKNLTTRFPGVRFVVYDTSDPSIEQGRKIVVAGQMELDF